MNLKRLSAKSQIALGETGLLLSLLLTAMFLGIVPDRLGAIREGRASLAEAVAINGSVFAGQGDLRRLEATLRVVVDRNEDLLSAAVRKADGTVLATIGDHDAQWEPLEDGHSTDAQLQVPIWAGERRWGQVELRFEPLLPAGILGFFANPQLILISFVSIGAFIVFYFYLGKMLKHLDPSQAVPTRVRSALDTLAEGLLVIDGKENIVLANQAFAETVAIASDDIVGRKASGFPWTSTKGELIEPDDFPWTRALRENAMQRKAMVRLQLEDGAHHTFMVNASPIPGPSGRAGGVLVSLDDVTQLEQKEIELRKSKEEAEEANKSKSAFLANMSHEIRTPMNAILGFTQLLKRGYGRGTQDHLKYLNTIHSSGQHLLDLINDILDLSKVEAGRLEIERTDCRPYAIIHEVLQILNVKAEEKGIMLAYEPDGPVPEHVTSDPARLRQIVTNLVGNAIKFTEQGGVTVVTRLVQHEDQPILEIDVIDTGIGMSPGKIESIFDPFSQADSSITRRFGGTGLGLAISRRFARALGGDIVATSEPGKGSTFHVTLETGPLEGVHFLQPEEILAAEAAEGPEERAYWKFPDARILVVDDGIENRELVTLVLEEAGLQTDQAENGQVSVDKALAEPFDVILMDVQMPVMDGYTATRILREKGLETPIVALTANAMKGFEKECLASGFTAYMTKPIDIDALLEMLAERLGGERTEAPPEAQHVPEPTDALPPSSARAAAGAAIVSRLPASDPRYSKVIRRFVERLDEQLGAMESAWQGRNFGELANLAHWLKGSGGTVGFDVFTSPAKHLEQLAKAKDESGEIDEVLAELRELAGRISLDADDADPTHLQAEVARERRAVKGPIVSRLPASDPRYRKVILRFVDRLDEQLDAMEAAWKAGDFDELAKLAHWLKGSGGTVGFDDFTAPAKHLEQLAKAGQGDQVEEAIAELRQLAAAIQGPEDDQPAQAVAS
jgi:PAS domain S-box-containing protein